MKKFVLLLALALTGFAANAQIPNLALVVAIVSAAALLLQMAREQLLQRQLNIVIQWLLILAAVFVWAIPAMSPIFNTLLMLWGLVICLIYAIFAGWIMKISHLRKAMNFSNELFYNLWRIAVRVVLPVSIILAMIAIIGQLF